MLFISTSEQLLTPPPRNKQMKSRLDKWTVTGLKTAWTARLKGLWPTARGPARGQPLVACPRGRYWGQDRLISSLMTWTIRQSVPSAESADDTQVGGVPDAPAGYAAVQVDGDRLEKQANQNLMKLKGKHQVLRFGRNNPQAPAWGWKTASHKKKVLGLLMVNRLNMVHQYALTVKEAHNLLDPKRIQPPHGGKQLFPSTRP